MFENIMTITQRLHHEIDILPETMKQEVLTFVRFLKWQKEEYLDDPRMSDEEKEDGLSYEMRQELLAEKKQAEQTGERYAFEDVFGNLS